MNIKVFSRIYSKEKTYNHYYTRDEKIKFLAKKFKNFLKNSILDVGCDEAYLKDYLDKNIKYIGVDLSGNPDFLIDLEKEKLKQFKNKSFYTVICIDVLEHLENIHEIFDELCRVAQKYLIISLPNNWLEFKIFLLQGKGFKKFYGLPISKPNDRHKWFFNYEEAQTFIKERGKINNFEIRHKIPTPFVFRNLQHQILNFFFKIYYKNHFGYKNLHYGAIWALLERKSI